MGKQPTPHPQPNKSMSNEFEISKEEFEKWYQPFFDGLTVDQYCDMGCKDYARAAWLYCNALAREEKRESAKNLLREAHINAACKEELAAKDDRIRELEAAIAVKDEALSQVKKLTAIFSDGRSHEIYITADKALTTSPDSGKSIVETLKWYGDIRNYQEIHIINVSSAYSNITKDQGAKARETLKGLGV